MFHKDKEPLPPCSFSLTGLHILAVSSEGIKSLLAVLAGYSPPPRHPLTMAYHQSFPNLEVVTKTTQSRLTNGYNLILATCISL